MRTFIRYMVCFSTIAAALARTAPCGEEKPSAALAQKLDSKVDIHFANAPLADVVAWLRTEAKIDVVLAGMDEATAPAADTAPIKSHLDDLAGSDFARTQSAINALWLLSRTRDADRVRAGLLGIIKDARASTAARLRARNMLEDMFRASAPGGVTMNIRNVSIRHGLRWICRMSGHAYRIDGDTVIVAPYLGFDDPFTGKIPASDAEKAWEAEVRAKLAKKAEEPIKFETISLLDEIKDRLWQEMSLQIIKDSDSEIRGSRVEFQSFLGALEKLLPAAGVGFALVDGAAYLGPARRVERLMGRGDHRPRASLALARKLEAPVSMEIGKTNLGESVAALMKQSGVEIKIEEGAPDAEWLKQKMADLANDDFQTREAASEALRGALKKEILLGTARQAIGLLAAEEKADPEARHRAKKLLGDPDAGPATGDASMRLMDAPFETALRQLCRRAKLKFRYDGDAVVVSSRVEFEEITEITDEDLPQPYERERSTRRLMNKRLTFDFQDKPLGEALEFIQRETKAPMVIDGAVDMQAKICLIVKNLSADKALDWILRAPNLNWAYQDGVVVISPSKGVE
jgi:hypothetical protein